MCVCLRILASSRIPRYDLGRRTLISEVVLSQYINTKRKKEEARTKEETWKKAEEEIDQKAK
jgi:hypothetical protein